MPKKVYLVRHGESEDGAQKLHQHDHAALSDRGNQQARDVAARFSGIPIDSIYSSPHARTLRTAEHVHAVTGAPLKQDALLRERRQPSEIIGKVRNSEEVVRIKKAMHEHRNDPSWHYSDEENFFDLKARVLEFQRFVEDQPQENILLVSHALFIKMFVMLAVFGELTTPDIFFAYYSHAQTSHTGMTLLEFNEKGPASPDERARRGGWRLLTWNDYAHLGEDLEANIVLN